MRMGGLIKKKRERMRGYNWADVNIFVTWDSLYNSFSKLLKRHLNFAFVRVVTFDLMFLL